MNFALENWPKVIFGTTPLGNLYRTIDDETKRAIVEAWFTHQKTPVFVDTAGKYGAGLALESLSRNFSSLGVSPEDVVISNKLAWSRVPLTTPEPTFEPGAWFGLEHDAVQNISYQGILDCYEQGNQLLSPYRSTMVSVHDPDEYLAAASDAEDRERRFSEILEGYRALQELKDSGAADSIGVGSKDWRAIEEIHEAGVRFDWVMIANSYTIMQHPSELLSFLTKLHKEGTAVINSAVFHGGFLTGGDFFDYRKVTEKSDPGLFTWRSKFMALCEEFKVAPANAASQFAIAPPEVTSLAVSSSRPSRVPELVELAEKPMPLEFRKATREQGLVSVDW